MVELILLGVLLLGVVAIIGWTISIFNRLVTLRNQVANGFAQIDVQLTRRHDLIPNLVETAKGYLRHERETLEAVIQARNQAAAGLKQAAADPTNALAIQQLAGAEGALAGLMGRLFALSEAYPDLQASENMQQLSAELAATEDRVALARQAFNDSVLNYNNAREIFPNRLIAGPMGFEAAQLLQIENVSMRQAPKVSFG
ncbi:MAG: LemA family protein [Chromatiaceae bacterium]|nr:MAG: LemA family protein [Chromatiaceae bacterium]